LYGRHADSGRHAYRSVLILQLPVGIGGAFFRGENFIWHLTASAAVEFRTFDYALVAKFGRILGTFCGFKYGMNHGRYPKPRLHSKGISIGSAIFAQITVVPDTTPCATSVAVAHIYALYACDAV